MEKDETLNREAFAEAYCQMLFCAGSPLKAASLVDDDAPKRGGESHDLTNSVEVAHDIAADDLAELRAAAQKRAAAFAASLTPEEQAIYGAKPQVAASAVRDDSD